MSSLFHQHKEEAMTDEAIKTIVIGAGTITLATSFYLCALLASKPYNKPRAVTRPTDNRATATPTKLVR
jgi:hypothetical protein